MPGTHGVTGPWFAWRLLAGNNRELGRSHAVFSDLESVHTAVADLLGSRRLLTGRHGLDPQTGAWTWTAGRGTTVVARSARGYLRAVEAEYSLLQFLDAIPRSRFLESPITTLRPVGS
jgi:hypothetical protein